MKLFRAPEPVPSKWWSHSLFLAGGIGAGAPVCDWQSELIERLSDTDWTLFNPRRDAYPAHDPHALREQIAWEHRHLQAARAILFWFPPETLCPVTLYELGAWANWRDEQRRPKPLVVGVHPDYLKLADIVIQLNLVRPEVEVVATLEDLEAQVRALASSDTGFL